MDNQKFNEKFPSLEDYRNVTNTCPKCNKEVYHGMKESECSHEDVELIQDYVGLVDEVGVMSSCTDNQKIIEIVKKHKRGLEHMGLDLLKELGIEEDLENKDVTITRRCNHCGRINDVVFSSSGKIYCIHCHKWIEKEETNETENNSD